MGVDTACVTYQMRRDMAIPSFLPRRRNRGQEEEALIGRRLVRYEYTPYSLPERRGRWA